MLSPAQLRERDQAAKQVLEFMRRRGLSLEDLVEVGGQDFSFKNPKRVEKARRVEKCWALMKPLGVKHVDLERNWPPASVSMPGWRSRRPRYSTVGRPLRDHVSTLLGIGPGCAKQLRLPHGLGVANDNLQRRRELLGEVAVPAEATS